MQDINLLEIRALNGDQRFAFEELCCQLAYLEPRETGCHFYRTGRGMDAGVECYVQNADGSEIGWQAKYFNCFESSQLGQLTKSFKSAVEKRPNLSRYIVCLPIDLKDGRTGKEKSELQRWQDWRKNQLAELDAGRKMDIELWHASTIRVRLFRNDAYYSGRVQYFFGSTHFSIDWFRNQFVLASKTLGERYTPEFHVALPIRQALFGISRNPKLEDQREAWVNTLSKQRYDLVMALKPPEPLALVSQTQRLIEALSQNVAVDEDYPCEDWQKQIKQLKKNLYGFMSPLWASKIEDERWLLNKLSNFNQVLDDIVDTLDTGSWRLVNEQALLISGEAGCGKSHLLADVANDALKQGCPAVLLIGSQFSELEPGGQMLAQLDLRDISFATFLGALDAAGQAAGERALLMIDALNERNGTKLWPHHLAALVEEVLRFRHVALIVSCRTTYLEYILPSASALSETLSCLKHHGFADSGGAAARAYLAMRHMVRPSVPNLLPEFNNPLFLKTCCDSLQKQGLSSFPRGVHGLTETFKFYLQTLEQQVEIRMGLDKRQKIISRALNAFTEQLLTLQSAYLPLIDTLRCFEAIWLSHGLSDSSLLTQLEHEGILTVEPYGDDEQVRFTFERFSDLQIADYLLQKHLEAGQTLPILTINSTLYEFFAREKIYRFAGIIEALAVLLPEQTEFEILDLVLPTIFNNRWQIQRAFLSSLLLRRQDKFSDKTWHLVCERFPDNSLPTLIAISTEPDNRYNAQFLHRKLTGLSLPERDAQWSVPIAEMGLEEAEPLEVLIDWAWHSGFETIEPERAELAAITLTWLFTCSHRTIRDRATKALTALLAPRLELALQLIEQFGTVDDLYLIERLLAACYGAVLQAKSEQYLGALALSVFQRFFADGKPPAHILLRDYAKGIIDYAEHRGLLPAGINLEKTRPPYQSDWPIEFVSEADLAVYGDSFRDDIVCSASSEWTGDFAKYIIAHAVGYWTAISLSSDQPISALQYLEMFIEKLAYAGTSGQHRAFLELYKFCLSRPDTNSVVSTDTDKWQLREQKEAKFNELEKQFMALLDNQSQFDYWTAARGGLMAYLHGYSHNKTESFNALLAQRWVTKRAHDFGWSKDLFGEFDQRIGTGRGRPNKHIERIGKKYQWLALYELLARIADHLIYRSGYSDDMGLYEGVWQIGKRNLDPSLLVDKSCCDGWKQYPAVWWSPQSLKLKQLSRAQQALWLENDNEQLNSSALLEVTESDSGQQWLVLKSFKHYSVSNDSGLNSDSWCRITCVVLKNEELDSFIAKVSKHTLIDPSALPKLGDFYSCFIGEYPWHPSYALDDDWDKLSTGYGFVGQVMPMVAEYNAESGNYDHSVTEGVGVHLPAPWLMRKLGLRLVDGRRLYFANAHGQVLFKDPSIYEEGPGAALVDKVAFVDLMQRENLSPVWVIAGEKGAYGERNNDYVGRREHSFIYVLDGQNKIICKEPTISLKMPG